MSNSVTVTVQLDGGSSASRSFDLGADGAAPAPPDAAGEGTAVENISVDAPPPAMDGISAATGSDDLPPPDVDDDASVSSNDTDGASDGGDSPPPPEA